MSGPPRPPRDTLPGIPGDNSAQRRIHFGRHSERLRLITALRDLTARATHIATLDLQPSPDRLASKLESCGRYASIIWSPGEERIAVSTALCKSRLCPTCSGKRSRRLLAQIGDIAAQMDSPRLITLTIRSRCESLLASIDRLKAAWVKLRRKQVWQQHVRGGVAVIEVTINSQTREWHPHLHCLVDGLYFPHKSLSKLWLDITKDSDIVDIRAAHSREAVSRYICKYVSKSNTPAGVTTPELMEWASALNHLRLFSTFGTLHGRERLPDHPDCHPGWERLALLAPLYDIADQGDAEAQALLRDLGDALSNQLSDRRPQNPPDAPPPVCALAGRIRAWWERRTGGNSGDPPPGPDPHPAGHRPSDRSERLWQEPDHPPVGLPDA